MPLYGAGTAFVMGLLHLQSDRTHERQCIAVLDHSRAHAVVEDHFAVDETVCEVDVGDSGIQAVGELSQRQVVGRDHSNRAVLDQAA